MAVNLEEMNPIFTSYENGAIKSKGDKINGSYVDYWPNGEIHKKCTYTNGKSNGDEIYFDKNGKIVYDNENIHCIIQ